MSDWQDFDLKWNCRELQSYSKGREKLTPINVFGEK